ncbi:MAG: hypothetical protein AAF542_06460 [Pseudomonadota bacterium]
MGQAQADAQQLMNVALSDAERYLTKYGEFFPFGAAMSPDGEISRVAAYDGDDQPLSSDLISMLKEAFVGAAKSGEYKATALAYDALVSSPGTGIKSDTVVINIDHSSGYSIVVFMPYSLTDGKLETGELFAENGANETFR